MAMRWYVVHVYSGFEKKVAEAIRLEARTQGMEDLIEEVMVPTEEVVEMRRGQKVSAERKFFPGYVLVKMNLTDQSWHLVQNTPKVTGFLGSNNKHPTWSGDDDEIAYVGDAENRRSISAVRLSDGAYRKITPQLSQNRHPDWSPDGRWIAFVTDRWDDIGDIAIVDAHGGGPVVRVTEGMDGHDDFPEWSPDSQRILFCGFVAEPPYIPNKEIMVAEDLPFDAIRVPVRQESMGSLKGAFRKR